MTAVADYRVYSSRLIRPDAGSEGVKLKVVEQFTVRDSRRYNQDFTFTLRNSPNGKRTVKVVDVKDLSTSTTGDSLQVERLVKFNEKTLEEQFMESISTFWNARDPITHRRTHTRKIYATDDNGNKNTDVWIKVRRTDQIHFVDPNDRSNQTIFYFRWPDLEDPEWDYTDVPTPIEDWSFNDSGINPPWRLDPFQDIIDCSFKSSNLVVFYSGNKVAVFSKAAITGGTYDTTFQATLTGSSWGATGPIKVNQLKTTTGEHMALSGLFFTGATGYIPAGETGGSTGGYLATYGNKYQLVNVLGEIAEGAVSSATAKRNVSTPNLGYSPYDPYFNGVSGAYYSYFDTYAVTSTGVSVTPQPESRFGYFATLEDGKYYSWFEAYSSFPSFYFSDFFRSTARFSAAHETAVDNLLNAWTPGTPGESVTAIFTIVGPDTRTSTNNVYAGISSDDPGAGIHINNDISHVVPQPVITATDGLDDLVQREVMFTLFARNANPTPYGNVAYLNWSAGFTGTSNIYASRVLFPPSLGTGPGEYYFIRDAQYPAATYPTATLDTPFTAPISVSDYLTFDGLWSVSNGSWLVQGFRVDGNTKAYFATATAATGASGASGASGSTGGALVYAKGSEISAGIAEKLGITANDIQAVFMDIPMSTINRLQ